MSEAGQIAPGDTVADRYRINRILGEGGMGVVYAAEHMLMRKEVALKVLHGEMCTMPEIVARFEREAVAAAAIDHPNVAGAMDFGRMPDGACYLVLELLKGTSLRDEIAKGPMSLDRALIILRGIANGVAAAHAKGIVHRDLKPENVMLVEREGVPDFVKVLDFGIAKMDANVTQPDSTGQKIVTRVGTIFGTPEYMAPEQAVGDKVDARADIFALGIVFLEMLTGKCAYKGEVLQVLRERILMMSPPDMSAIESEGARALITKMMQRHPDDRVQTALELVAAIDQLETTPTQTAVAKSIVAEEWRASSGSTTPSSNEKTTRPKWLIPGVLGGATLLVFIVAFSASGSSTPGDKSDKTKEQKQEHKHAAGAPSSSGVKLGPPVPTVVAEPTPSAAPSASASAAEVEPEPEPEAKASAVPAATHAPTAQPKAKPKPPPRKTGPGGIYIPPPNEWFK